MHIRFTCLTASRGVGKQLEAFKNYTIFDDFCLGPYYANYTLPNPTTTSGAKNM